VGISAAGRLVDARCMRSPITVLAVALRAAPALAGKPKRTTTATRTGYLAIHAGFAHGRYA